MEWTTHPVSTSNPGMACCFVGARTQAEIDEGVPAMAAHRGDEGFCQPGYTAIIDRIVKADHPNHSSQPQENAPQFWWQGVPSDTAHNGWIQSPSCQIAVGQLTAMDPHAGWLTMKGTRCIAYGCPILSDPSLWSGSSLITWPGPTTSSGRD